MDKEATTKTKEHTVGQEKRTEKWHAADGTHRLALPVSKMTLKGPCGGDPIAISP
jgi:hypothetical protein